MNFTVQMGISLRKKIFLGYIIITAIVLFLTIVMVNEHFRFRRFESVINETNDARENIHKANLYITRLATLGESVIAWNESDYNKYHHQRLKTDSILLEIKSRYDNFLCPDQIDSLRVLFETKEMHLFRIMKAVIYSNGGYCVFIILILFFIIRFDLRKEEKIKFQLQQTIQENEN